MYPNRTEMTNVFIRALNELFSLAFPSLCLGCRKELLMDQKSICFFCELELPMTYFHLDEGIIAGLKTEFSPQVKELFSLYFFKENGLLENLLYQLKYQGNKKIGRFFGQQLAEIIKTKKNAYKGIIGVPLHPKRKRKRGYNQMDIIGRAAANASGIPYLENRLLRTKNTPALAKISGDRSKIVRDAFALHPKQKIAPGHYLLIDDIFTSGATLQACSSILLKDSTLQLSIATIAFRD